jgi:hypothetical protein
MQINSKNLEKLSKQLRNVDIIIDKLNGSTPVSLQLEGDTGQVSFILGVGPYDDSTYELTKKLSSAFTEYRSSIERKILSEVRP